VEVPGLGDEGVLGTGCTRVGEQRWQVQAIERQGLEAVKQGGTQCALAHAAAAAEEQARAGGEVEKGRGVRRE
jgi:hypothetical protein